MKKWLRRIRGAVGMGLTWAAAWAPVGVLMGTIVDRDGSMDEMWGAVTGLLLGGIAVVAGVASAAFPDLWLRAAVIIGPATLLGAVSGSASLAIARMAQPRKTSLVQLWARGPTT